MLRRFVISGVLVCLALGAAARTRPHYGGTLRIETQGDPWQVPDGMARRLVLDTLTTVADIGGARPALAVRWESQNADHRWEFWIRPEVRFQDGTALTADAVAAALDETCSHAACPWRMVRGVGPSVVFTSDSPVPDLPELLAQTQFAIAKQDATGAVVGTGPFRVTGFANGALNLARFIRDHRLGQHFPAVTQDCLFQSGAAPIVVNAARRPVRNRDYAGIDLHQRFDFESNVTFMIRMVLSTALHMS